MSKEASDWRQDGEKRVNRAVKVDYKEEDRWEILNI